MRNFGKILTSCGIVLLLIAGCSGKKEPATMAQTPVKVLAKVNGTAITEDDLRIQVRTGHGMAPDREKVRAIDDVINAELFYQEALKLGLDKDPTYIRLVERYEKQLSNMKRAELTRRMYNIHIASKIDVTRQEAEDFYKKHLDNISKQLHLGMVVFPTREEAEAALKQISSGKTFKEVAAVLTAGMPAGARPQWDMGFVPWEQIPIDCEDAVYKLKPGEVSAVLPYEHSSFRIFTLLENPKKSQTDFNSQSGLIMTRLRDKKILDAYEAYLAKLRKNAKIEQFK